jgi:hypothetical protein
MNVLSLVSQDQLYRSSLMRSFLRCTTLAASLLVTASAVPGCHSNEDAGGNTDAGAMDKGKMGGGAMDKDKMDGGAMDKGKMDGEPK